MAVHRAVGIDDDDLATELLTSADTLRDALEETPLERVEDADAPVEEGG